MFPFTEKQGQYLAFIYYYTKVHRRPPAEWEIQQFFRTSGPNVHQMIVRLEENGLIRKIPWEARSIQVLVPPEMIPELK